MKPKKLYMILNSHLILAAFVGVASNGVPFGVTQTKKVKVSSNKKSTNTDLTLVTQEDIDSETISANRLMQAVITLNLLAIVVFTIANKIFIVRQQSALHSSQPFFISIRALRL